ncbi:MAG: hypothetical protein KBD37_01245 [Burkholderiales bacterium]|nr:hypothetical protein [Burkholderiales bacterium]
MKIVKKNFSNSLKLGLGVVFCGLTACNGAGSAGGGGSTNPVALPALNSADSNNLKDSLYLMRIGSGVDSVTHTATSGQTCLANASNQNNIYIGNPSSLINFDQKAELTNLETALNVDVDSKVGGDRFGGSLSAQFANSAKETNYTTNLLYLYEYAGKAVFKDGSLGQGFDALTPYAASLEQTSPTDFRTMCGDNFVEQMDAGSVLAVNLSLRFNSRNDKENFDMQLKGSVSGLASVTAGIQQAVNNSNVHVELVLSAIQQGGQPEKLNEIFGKPDSSGNYPFLQCETGPSSAGLDACNLMISNIITYAQTMKDQLTNADGSIKLNNLYYTNPAFTPYSHLGITMQGAADPSKEILDAMEQLTAQYDNAIYDYNFVTHYLSVLSNKMDSSTKSTLNDAATRLSKQINNVFLLPAYDIADCYKGYVSTRCLTIRDNVEHALIPYTLTDTEVKLLNYLEHNSYITDGIFTYSGGANPSQQDYALDSSCIFAPISSPSAARYAINCDGKWLTTANSKGVTIMPGFGGEGVNVTNLAYISTPPNTTTNGQLITYMDTMLMVSADNPDSFYTDSIEVSAPQLTTSTDFILTRDGDNKA